VKDDVAGLELELCGLDGAGGAASACNNNEQTKWSIGRTTADIVIKTHAYQQ